MQQDRRYAVDWCSMKIGWCSCPTPKNCRCIIESFIIDSSKLPESSSANIIMILSYSPPFFSRNLWKERTCVRRIDLFVFQKLIENDESQCTLGSGSMTRKPSKRSASPARSHWDTRFCPEALIMCNNIEQKRVQFELKDGFVSILDHSSFAVAKTLS